MSDITLDSMLDVSLDDIADLPEFLVLPAGAYRVTINFEAKKINEHPAVEAKIKVLEVLELSDPSATPPAAGAESSVAYMMDNEFGQGNFKKIVKPLCEHHGIGNIMQAVAASQGMEVMVVTKQRQNKDKTATYLDITALQVL